MLWQYYDNKISFETVTSRLEAISNLVSWEDVNNFLDSLLKGFIEKWEDLFSGSPYKTWKAIGDIIFISITWGVMVSSALFIKKALKLIKPIESITSIIKWQNKRSSIWNMRNDYVFERGMFYA